MMGRALSDKDDLPLQVGLQGGASKLLRDGPTITREIESELTIQNDAGENQYAFTLLYAADDTLVFANERYRFSMYDSACRADWRETGAGHRSPQLLARAAEDATARSIRDVLRKIVVYQFHNTAYTARMRHGWDINDDRRLKEDAANLAPVLSRLREMDGISYQRIVDTIRLILPFFSDFELEVKYGSLLMNWRERNSDLVFSASQASDGMLRVMALVTLLLQPADDLPDVLILDEPELGLHPYAVNIIGGLIRAASQNTQVIVATQSAALVDCFEPEDIVVVERDGRNSTFAHIDAESLSEWLKHYSLSELWEKNVIGGRP